MKHLDALAITDAGGEGDAGNAWCGDLQRNIANHQRITKGQIGAGQPVNQQIFTKKPARSARSR